MDKLPTLNVTPPDPITFKTSSDFVYFRDDYAASKYMCSTWLFLLSMLVAYLYYVFFAVLEVEVKCKGQVLLECFFYAVSFMLKKQLLHLL
jgi:hypothetical protein